jgi:peptide/nickel transport system ATP-binding protein
MHEMKDKFGMAIMLITHAMGVVAETCQRVTVMYAGKVVEEAPVEALFGDPQHPYTLGLLGSIPKLQGEEERLAAIRGMVPNPYAMPAGCRFNPRCPLADARCRSEAPPLVEIKPGHRSACWKAPLELVLPAAGKAI